ncbi:MAG: response regulator [Bacteroidales bacterium]|nr:response regulator [Bacteroidales bacterium]
MPNKKILVVDDIIDNIQIIVEIFAEYSPEYTVYQANNSKLAYEISLKTKPDLIITDWHMPEMSGIELLKKLNSNPETKSIPVIMATGVMTTVENLKTALDAGAVDYIRKPIDKVELVARTKSTLNLADFNKRIIEQKDQELVENTLLLIKNNEFNLQITKKLQNLHNLSSSKNNKFLIQDIINDIDQKIKSDSWQRFDMSFNAVYEEFYKNILEDFPDLTSTELKLSAFLKLGLNSKDIASIMYINPDSVKVSRSRLRKKLNLDSDVNLQIFLSKY